MYVLPPEPGRLGFKPDAVVRRHLFFREKLLDPSPVPVSGGRGDVDEKRHQRAVIAVLDAVAVFVLLETLRSVTAGKEEDPKAAAAPASADRKIQAVAEALRAMPGEKHTERDDGSSEVYREPPGEGAQIEFLFGNSRIRAEFSQFHFSRPHRISINCCRIAAKRASCMPKSFSL